MIQKPSLYWKITYGIQEQKVNLYIMLFLHKDQIIALPNQHKVFVLYKTYT